MSSNKSLRQYLSQLLLAVPYENFEAPEEVSDEFKSIQAPIEYILKGNSSDLLVHQDYEELLFSDTLKGVLGKFPEADLFSVLNQYLEQVFGNFEAKFGDVSKLHLQLLAIAFLQTFIQLNYTGPSVSYSSKQVFFPEADEIVAQFETVKLLNLEGQQAYDLIQDPILLILASLVFEKLMGVESKYSLVNLDPAVSVEEVNDVTMKIVEDLNSPLDPINASLFWWRSRALQVHLSILSEPASLTSTLTSILLNSSVPNAICPASDNNAEIQKHIQLVYYLECARSGVHGQTEHLSVPLLGKARKLSDLNFIMSGAKAKRTKFQKFHTSALIVLAKSKPSSLYTEDGGENPENLTLDSDLLLEKPQFESLDDLQMEEEPNSKRIKFDEFAPQDDDGEKLLPIAFRQDDIPQDLKELDPNNQPVLNDLDNVQLLLRLTTLKQTSPSSDALVEEQLMALVSRVLYTSSTKLNWTIFSRALWERSVLETSKARTVERGILQMTSLVEEIGIKIKTRIMPQANDTDDFSPSSSRLRFIHQLPLMPQWSLDAKLAEKYMSLGVLRSAVEIFERLQMSCEAALCYAAVDEEKQAVDILEARIKSHPEDARAISILGDIKQDPSYWEKAWEIGRYAKSKAALARYYYNPPRSSGLSCNLELAISHMFDCLKMSPLSYENWFFYGCCGLEAQQYGLASEAFTRCVSLDDSNSHAWSNLGTALLRTDKTRQAFNALKKAIRSAGENSKKSWRIYENYLLVAAKLNEWNDVLIGIKLVVEIRKSEGDVAIDIPVIEKLVEILTATEFPQDQRLSHYQSSCIDLVCNVLPSVITSSARCWRVVARVELWRKKPWVALECHEKAYRALVHKPELETSEDAWNDAVDSLSDLVGAYESLGELPGKHGAGDVVCKDWKYKSRTTIRSLMSKGKMMWEDSEGWNRLQQMKEDL